MAGSVSVVEDRSPSSLALVLGDDERLRRDAAKYDPLEHRTVSIEKARSYLLQEVEQAPVHGNGVLYNLGERFPISGRGQRFDARKVGDDRGRLPEGTNGVLGAGPIDAGLASDARIDHRQERRRYTCLL